MKPSLTTFKELIGASPRHDDLFLSVISEDGSISNANQHMVRNLELSDPRSTPINFFDLIHPINLAEFRNTLVNVSQDCSSKGVEIYVKNGHYHPMRWQVSCLGRERGMPRSFLCVGYRLLDQYRASRFNGLMSKNTELILEGLSGIIFQDQSGEIIAANQKSARIYDCSLETLYQIRDIGVMWDTSWKVFDEDGAPVAFADTPFMKTVQTGLPHTGTIRVLLRNGDWRWIYYDCHYIAGDSLHNPEAAVLSHLVDVTEERRLSAQVREQEALIGSYLKQTPHLGWVVDEDANLLFASDSFIQHFEVDAKSISGKKATDVVPAYVTMAVYDLHIKVFETGQSMESTQQVKWADGANYGFYIHLFPIKSYGGKKLVGGQAIRLPDKSKLEKELREAHARLLTYSKATTDAIWEWDMQTGQMFRNETLMNMVGYQMDTSKGITWWLKSIHPEDRNRVADKVKEATDTMQQSWQDEYRFKCADGTYKYVQDRGFVVYESGLPVKMIGSLQDISAMKELELKLADERLQKQKDISETVIRVQEKERTRIGHELHDNVNQILSTAKLFIDMIKPDGREQREIREKTSSYLLMAIEEIRKLSRELVVPQLKHDNLAESIQTLIQDIQMAGTIKITFAHSVDLSNLSAGRSTTIFRIIQEQLKNILKHSKANTVDILLEVDDENCVLEVKDNGKGFNPRQTTQGIGLSNIHERSLFYNGQTEIESAPGKGCRVKVTIPVMD
ncbi:MAG: PAS domain S-box protein [Chitinophagaceae bacterium]|nr:MAG: PAS domain S-box protein [Chitinophagaceae bacterium]